MSSVDFKAYVEAERGEHVRLAGVYRGVEGDKNPAVEHLVIDHLRKLLSSNISLELRALYLKEYDMMRAHLRSIAVASLRRSDFYDEAAREETNDAKIMGIYSSSNQNLGAALISALPEETRAYLSELEAEYEERKIQSELRVRDQGNMPTGISLKDEDVIRHAMVGVSGVNPRGVSTSTKGY